MAHPLSPRLDHCPPGLPRAAYLDAGWFQHEMRAVFGREWVCVGRLADLASGTMRPLLLGDAPVFLARDGEGSVRAWHNTCPHRGAELCAAEQPMGKLIRCPYHAFAFSAADGHLVSTAHARPTADFDRAAHGLNAVQVRLWAGFVFLNASPDPGPLWSDVPLETLDNWPMDALITGHRHSVILECNWKGFWENYSECLHCPGIHPELCERVPIYGSGIMGASEAHDWTPEAPATPNLKPGAQSWTMDGAPCGPVFPGLTAQERDAGYTFVTLWPSVYVVAHVDYVRAVRLEPIGPEQTCLTAEWYFPPETLAQPGFDAAKVAAFAKIVLDQDGAAAELNQRGVRSPAFTRATLMPEEYEIARFHAWVRAHLEACP